MLANAVHISHNISADDMGITTNLRASNFISLSSTYFCRPHFRNCREDNVILAEITWVIPGKDFFRAPVHSL
jgi:hypothetical protein